MSSKKSKKKKFIERFFITLLTLILIGVSLFTIYELYKLTDIANQKRYILMSLIALITLIFIIRSIIVKKNKTKSNGKKPSTKLYLTFSTIFILLIGAIGYIINDAYGAISNMNKVYVTYSSSLVTMNSSDIEEISDVKYTTIGMLTDETSPEGNIIPSEIMKENNLYDDNDIIDYEDYSSMISDLYNDEIDLVFLPSSYTSMFSNIEEFSNIETDTKIIISKDKKMKKSSTESTELESSKKSVDEPFTILLMGVDSTEEVLDKNEVANGDTLILVTFNPDTLNATMLSIPRDSYVPISCWSDKAENKITHAAAYGNDCMINTIEDYLDINIDYYAKINFKGFVKLIDAVDGVTVDVPKDLCTDSSDRTGEVCIEEGTQTLSGEEALVFVRNRKQLSNGDFGRAYHQQLVIKALIEKLKDINLTQFNNVLNTISNSMDTNLTTEQILSFYNVAKDIQNNSLAADSSDLINIDRLYLQGEGQMIYDERTKLVLWDYVPNKDSRNDIVEAMKENLELEEHDDITEFEFSVNEPYEKEVIGYGPYKKSYTYALLPDFTGDSYQTAKSYASKNGISVIFNGTGGYVVSQNYPANKRLDKIKGSVTLTLSYGANKKSNSTDDDDEEENDNKEKTKSTSATCAAKNRYFISSDQDCGGCTAGYTEVAGTCVTDTTKDEDNPDDEEIEDDSAEEETPNNNG